MPRAMTPAVALSKPPLNSTIAFLPIFMRPFVYAVPAFLTQKINKKPLKPKILLADNINVGKESDGNGARMRNL
jgi:hypothetical protein